MVVRIAMLVVCTCFAGGRITCHNKDQKNNKYRVGLNRYTRDNYWNNFMPNVNGVLTNMIFSFTIMIIGSSMFDKEKEGTKLIGNLRMVYGF